MRALVLALAVLGAACGSSTLSAIDAGAVDAVSPDSAAPDAPVDAAQVPPDTLVVPADAAVDAPLDAPLAEMVLDPPSITFFALPINSLRWAISGLDPARNQCATIIWDYSNTGHAGGAHCDDFGDSFPYVVISDPPCGTWMYSGNEVVAAASGCVDFKGSSAASSDLVDVTVDVTGAGFTGRIRASNRAALHPAPVVLGIQFTNDIPEDVYLQVGDEYGLPAWVTVANADGPLLLWDRCDAPICGETSGVCGAALPRVRNLTDGGFSGRADVVWDGQMRVLDDVNHCYQRRPAPTSTYTAHFCLGFGVMGTGGPGESAGTIDHPSCTDVSFSVPTETVVWHAGFGG